VGTAEVTPGVVVGATGLVGGDPVPPGVVGLPGGDPVAGSRISVIAPVDSKLNPAAIHWVADGHTTALREPVPANV
jgi:hypothetical protein